MRHKTTVPSGHTSMRWLHRAACRTEDPGVFFPIGTAAPALQQIEEAKTICRHCEVTDACLDWALRTGQDTGVWGGLSEEERRALRRRSSSPPREENQELPARPLLQSNGQPRGCR
ncbi:hypothetical protein GCM10009741_21090 [Kribbella lupini]|uniref:Transcriptional regulator WhiB n=2 Tax=Kribbella lupini TaxID=291602 RepID=A0ABN2AJZ0_9ACTN